MRRVLSHWEHSIFIACLLILLLSINISYSTVEAVSLYDISVSFLTSIFSSKSPEDHIKDDIPTVSLHLAHDSDEHRYHVKGRYQECLISAERVHGAIYSLCENTEAFHRFALFFFSCLFENLVPPCPLYSLGGTCTGDPRLGEDAYELFQEVELQLKRHLVSSKAFWGSRRDLLLTQELQQSMEQATYDALELERYAVSTGISTHEELDRFFSFTSESSRETVQGLAGAVQGVARIEAASAQTAQSLHVAKEALNAALSESETSLERDRDILLRLEDTTKDLVRKADRLNKKVTATNARVLRVVQSVSMTGSHFTGFMIFSESLIVYFLLVACSTLVRIVIIGQSFYIALGCDVVLMVGFITVEMLFRVNAAYVGGWLLILSSSWFICALFDVLTTLFSYSLFFSPLSSTSPLVEHLSDYSSKSGVLVERLCVGWKGVFFIFLVWTWWRSSLIKMNGSMGANRSLYLMDSTIVNKAFHHRHHKLNSFTHEIKSFQCSEKNSN